jgi:hypothetical protein
MLPRLACLLLSPLLLWHAVLIQKVETRPLPESLLSHNLPQADSQGPNDGQPHPSQMDAQQHVSLSGKIPITSLPLDGLLVTKHGQVRATSGKWKVLVTMDVPKAPIGLRNELFEVTRMVASAPVSATTRHAWRRRLDQITLSLPLLNMTVKPILAGRVRNPRGLLDPLGVLVHDIFGLATSAEVNNIKAVLRAVSQNQGAIATKFDLLTTVVNRSRLFEQENREFIKSLSNRVRNTQEFLHNLTRNFSLLSLRVTMEQVSEDLEQQAATLQSFQRLYAHRRQDLHNLKLSEELLPVSSLKTILDSAATYHSVAIADLNWYYTHESVRPMWATPDFLVYEVDLHLVNPSTFLLYRMHGWPVPTGPSLSVRILQTGDFGYDTNTGQLFEANHCVGYEPTVCSTGILFKSNAPPCVRGILKGDHKLMGRCPVELRSGNTSQLYYLADNEYILSTWGDILEARCTGHNSHTVNIARGVYNIILPADCSLSSPVWTISAISLHHLDIHLVSQQLPRPLAVNLSALIDPSQSLSPLVSPQLAMGSIAPIPLAALRLPLLEPPKLHEEAHHLLRNMILAISATLFAVFITYITCMNRVYCWTWCKGSHQCGRSCWWRSCWQTPKARTPHIRGAAERQGHVSRNDRWCVNFSLMCEL